MPLAVFEEKYRTFLQILAIYVQAPSDKSMVMVRQMHQT